MADDAPIHSPHSLPDNLAGGFLTIGSATPAKPVRMPRQISLAELCRRLVMDSYAPAAVLNDSSNACIFSMGPTDRYLRIAPGYPTTDLLAMATPGLKITISASSAWATCSIIMSASDPPPIGDRASPSRCRWSG